MRNKATARLWSVGIALCCASLMGKATAAPIPLEEEFVFHQAFYVSASWGGVIDLILEDEGVVDLSPMIYDGTFSIFTAPDAVPLGTFSGLLAGMYAGAFREVSYIGTMETLSPDKEIKVDSKLTENGTEKGTDKGTITERGAKADVDIRITRLAGSRDLKGSDLSFSKADGKLTVTGTIERNDKESRIKFVLTQATNEFTYAEVAVKAGGGVRSQGAFIEIPSDEPLRRDFQLEFDTVAVPEPQTAYLFVLAGIGLIGWRKLRPAGKH